MFYGIYIDTGGTFTDAFVCRDSSIVTAKVDTTPDDFSVGVLNVVEAAAKKLGLDSRGLLASTEVFVLSTTVATNILVQKSGIKVGLIVTKGFEESIYGEAKSSLFDFLLKRELVVGVKGDVDNTGSVIEPINKEEVIGAIRSVLAQGARMIVVSLHNASLDTSLEREVKQVLYDNYPTYFLGSIPMILSSEICLSTDNLIRTNSAVVDGYVHQQMVRFLYKLESELKKRGLRNPLLAAQAFGGASRVSLTKALMTVGSGPTGGISGVESISGLLDVPNLVSCDIGGTSADIAIYHGGRCIDKLEWDMMGTPLELVAKELDSKDGGGGTICKIKDGKLILGPESAGSAPGPACYDLGGTKATITDACIVLGYLDPDYFLGGRRRLKAAKARDVISRNIAVPLGIKTEDAAYKIYTALVDSISKPIGDKIQQNKYSPKDVALVSFGGAGGLFCAGIAANLGLAEVVVPPYASEFCAYGLSTVNIMHEFEARLDILLRKASGEYNTNTNAITEAVEKLREKAVREFRAEGRDIEKVSFSLQLGIRSSKPSFVARIPFAKLEFQNEKDVKTVCAQLDKFSSSRAIGEIHLERIWYRGSYPVPHNMLAEQKLGGKDASPAFKGKRDAFMQGKFNETPLYDLSMLCAGNEVVGPAIIEADDTTILVPEEHKYFVDKYGIGILQKE